MALRKILVIEDSGLLQKGYDLIFRPYRTNGVQVVHSYNGREGLQKLAEHPDIGLIILDINMPVMSGIEFLEQRARQPAFARIPVIVVSTEGAEEDIVRGLRAGAAAYLVKPFKVDELYSLIERVTPPASRPRHGPPPGPRERRNV